MTDDPRVSAFLDEELDADEAVAFARDLDADGELRAEVDAVARVRSTLRAAALVVPGDDALARIVAAVDRADDGEAPDRPGSEAVPPTRLAPRRRVTMAAAAVMTVAAVIAVVGGLGGRSTVPAVGDLVARHDAAASGAMPDGSEPMPMDDMPRAMPVMGGDLTMEAAFHDDTGLMQVVYSDSDGAAVSVFRQDGDTDLHHMDDGEMEGEMEEVGGTEMWSSTMADTAVAVVDGDGYVWTLVGAMGHDEMMEMADELPTRSPGVGERLRDVADAIVRPWRLG